MDPGRHFAPPPMERKSRSVEFLSLSASHNVSLPSQHKHRHAVASRRASGAKPAQRGHYLLLVEIGAGRPGDARSFGREGENRASVFKRRNSQTAGHESLSRGALLGETRRGTLSKF